MIFPAVVKNVLRSEGLPANVRAVAVPPTVTFPPLLAAMTPSAIDSVTVSDDESSVNTDPGKTRLPTTSSAIVKDDGVRSLGASLTFVTEIVKDFSVKRPPASVVRTRIE